MPDEDPLDLNRRWWDESAIDHFERTYDLHLLRDGGETLYPIESVELPADLSGLRICHLQCHIGPDSLSLARRGADVVGVDFSPEAVARATQLAAEVGLADRTTFVESTVQDARRALDGAFDAVFVTWGALVWLPDMDEWAGIVHSLLRPGGWLYLAEHHPYAVGVAYPEQPYGGGAAVRIDEPGDYKDPAAERAHTVTIEYAHGLGDIVTALTAAGLRIDWLHEHLGLPWPLSKDLVLGDARLYRRPDSFVPLSLSLHATRP